MAEDIGSMVEKIMKNPEFQEMVGELRGTDAPGSEDLMSRLPEVMAQLSPLLGTTSGPGSGGGEPPPQTVSTPETPVVRGGRFNKKNAERLLAALRPYLRESRCGIIDKCMSVMQISDLIGAAGLAGGLPGLSAGTKPEAGEEP